MAWVEGKEHKNSDRLGNKLGKRAWNRAKNAPYIYYIGRNGEKHTLFFSTTAKNVLKWECVVCYINILTTSTPKDNGRKNGRENGKGATFGIASRNTLRKCLSKHSSKSVGLTETIG